MEEGLTVLERFGPIPLGPLKLEIIQVFFNVSNSLGSMLSNASMPENLNWAKLDTRMSNPKYVFIGGQNEVALNFGRTRIEGKILNIAPFAAVNATVVVVGL